MNMQLFRFIGDFLAVSSRVALVRKIYTTNSLSGLSLKTQLIYLFVYVFRYLDLLNAPAVLGRKIINRSSVLLFLYNTFFKLVYIGFQIYLVAQFYNRRKYTYSRKFDTFPLGIFMAVACALSFFLKDITSDIFFNLFSYIKEYFYTCSLILESLAILPQLVLTQDSGECEKLVAVFITCLGLYRLNYFVFFVVSKMGGSKVDTLLVASSLVQSVLYIDFYRVYFSLFMKKY